MTFEERIHEYCLQSDIVYERILSLSCEKDLYILYPSELANEQIPPRQYSKDAKSN